MDSHFANPINIDKLLLSKHLDPLSNENIKILERIQSYSDVENYNEAEVRSFIIDPILRVLGYDKGTPFSTSLEKHLTFVGQRRRSDYQIHLWEENFWLLEAKRPMVGATSFGYEDFSQALEYSVHPSVNAALIVLCDGLILEIFDREVDVEKPLLHVEIKNIIAEIDKVRAILEPMQIWFFQKRRIIRLLDRVFDKEFVIDRVEEFSELLKRRLQGKRNTTVENFRKNIKSDSEEQRKIVENATLAELAGHYMRFDFPTLIANAVNQRLLQLSTPSSFQVVHKLFPDYPEPTNDHFTAQAAVYLIGLAEKKDTVEFLPAWLGRGRQSNSELDAPIKFLLEQCLTYFKDYEAYRLVLLAACAIRRITKINAISDNRIQKLGEDLHALARYIIPEISWAQVLASPKDQLLRVIDVQVIGALDSFVRNNKSKEGKFRVESAKLQLRQYWELEKRLLSAIPNYPALLKERALGEMQMTECSSVTYDNLAHSTLARLHAFSKWKTYLFEDRRELIEQVASCGSWAAKEILGISAETEFEPMSDIQLADRFFLGDIEIFRSIRQGYRNT